MFAILEEIRLAYASYNLYVYPMVFAFVALGFFLVKWKKEYVDLFAYICVAWALLLIPGIATVILRFKADKGQTWLVYGILAVSFLTVYTMTEYLADKKRIKQFAASFALMVVLMLASIGVGISFQNFGLFNWYKTDKEVIAIAKAVEEVEAEDNLFEPVLLGPDEVMAEIRSVDCHIGVYYGDEYSYSPEDTSYLMYEAENYGCNLLVVEKKYTEDEQVAVYEENGFEELMQTKSYTVYIRRN